MAIQPPPEASKRVQVMVVGLGMVGIGKPCDWSGVGGADLPAFIEKMLTLDTVGKYHIRTCGEEPTVAYNRVGLTGTSPSVPCETLS
jgi:NAD(P)H-nitrite reductase large subunit